MPNLQARIKKSKSKDRKRSGERCSEEKYKELRRRNIEGAGGKKEEKKRKNKRQKSELDQRCAAGSRCRSR